MAYRIPCSVMPHYCPGRCSLKGNPINDKHGSNAGIMTKVYFPRRVMPISGIISPIIDFCIAFVILILMMAYYGFVPPIAIVLLPLFILLALATSLAIGLWLSALNIKYRDFQYTLPFIIQLGLFASPIVYPSSMISAQYWIFYGFNPMGWRD